MKDESKIKSWKDEFYNRLLRFSVRIIGICNSLPSSPTGFAISSQLIRSATSVGANFIEAQDASSSKDFIHKLGISLREAKETKYWLEIIQSSNLTKINIKNDLDEVSEIVAVLSSSVKSSKLKLLTK